MKLPLPLPFALALCLLYSACLPVHAAGQEPVSLDFDNADISSVARTLNVITHRNIVVDPRVKGAISLHTETLVSPQQAWTMFTDVLRLSGYSVVTSGGLDRIVPEPDAKLLSTAVLVDGQRPAGDAIATEIIRLDYQNAANLLPVLRPLISPNNVINVNAGNNSLVITDYSSNLARLRSLVAALDTPSATDVEVIPLRNTTASDTAATVRRLSALSSASAVASAQPAAAGAGAAAASAQPAGAGTASTEATIVVDTQTNSLLVRAQSRAQLAAIRALVAQLDQPRDKVNVRVVYLKNAQATRLAQVLRAAFPVEAADTGAAGRSGGAAAGVGLGGGTTAAVADTASSSSSGSGTTAGSKASAATTSSVTAAGQPTTGGGIQADPASNALIITAPEPRFREMRPIIEQLDTRRAQLYVESLVVEVDASKTVELGVQWSQLFDISSSTTLTLGTVAKALESMAGTNILSTANVVTLDNEEAKIVVGQNVPYITGSYTTSTNSNPFQTVERKDVGITLRLRPQIGENGNIRMTIYQESSSVASTSTTLGPTTNQRSIESTVTVNDGKIIVLGGLIEDRYSDEAYRLPWVADLPLLGGIFRSFSRSRKKTNLIVFLRPVAVRDDAAMASMTMDRYDYILGQQKAMPGDISKLPGGFLVGPVLP